MSKAERFAEFLRRLAAAECATTVEEAYHLLVTVLTTVEDELTTIPNHPEQWQTDGRMYPPQTDNQRSVAGHPLVQRYRSRAHNTLIGANGALAIQSVANDELLLNKPGADGRNVWSL